MEWYIILAALLPAAVLLYLIWKRDKYQREPVWMILLAFLAGMVSVPISLIVSYPAIMIWYESIGLSVGNFINSAFNAFVGAAIPEELAKFLVLWLFLFKNKWFDEYMDGIVYAVAISMGFAGLENILYLADAESWGLVAGMRALLTVPMHFACGVVMGYYYSLWRIENNSKWLKYAIAMPIIFHGLFDFALMYFSSSESVSTGLLAAFLIGLHYFRKYCTELINRHLNNDSSRFTSVSPTEE